MDGGRKADLEELVRRSNGASSAEKRELEMVKKRILTQPKEITQLRERLINATRFGKAGDTAQLSQQIKEVERRTYRKDSWEGN